MFGRGKSNRNPAVPLPWRTDRTPPPGFDRPPTTEELAKRRKQDRPAPWEPPPSTIPEPNIATSTVSAPVQTGHVVVDDDFDHLDVNENWPEPNTSVPPSSDHANDGDREGNRSDVGDGRADPSIGLSVFRGRPTTMRFGSSRIAVLGDVGGVLSCFETALTRLGVHGDTIPDGLVIVQLGDLVGGLGDDEVLIARVDALMRVNPGSWVQLVGNWEARHLPGWPWFGATREQHPLDGSSVATLRRWWDSAEMRVAVALETAVGQTLITHAGLTGVLWHELGKPRNAESAAQALNEVSLELPQIIARAGEMMSRHRNGDVVKIRHLGAGPIWASASELWTSWTDEPTMPFNQIVGHTAPFHFNKNRWSPVEGTHPKLIAQSVPDAALRHVTHTHQCGATIRSIDCGVHERAAADHLRPVHVNEARTLR
jgi:hypothetical protein